MCACDLQPHLPPLYLYPYPNLGTFSSGSRHNIKCSYTLTNTHLSKAVVDHELVNTKWCRATRRAWITVALLLTIPACLSFLVHSCLPAHPFPPLSLLLFFCPTLSFALLCHYSSHFTPPPISFLHLSLFILPSFSLIDPVPLMVPPSCLSGINSLPLRKFQERVMHCRTVIVKIKDTHFELYCYPLLNALPDILLQSH